jgi:rhamnose utilization protein RhaD (predicted bifunctional aldolase and dehydrogenase)
MNSQWTDADAKKAIAEYGAKGVSEDLALRTYTTRLLGRDPMLVLHGGGNTSVKTRMTDLLGEEHDVLCVKGSGWDMGVIEPPGLPAVKLKPLQKLRVRKDLSDEDMVNFQRANLLDTFAPNPSVETLLHAFLPHKFVDHTHAAAVLSLVDQPNGEELVAEVYGGKMGFVPYVISGFTLSKLAAEVYDKDPKVEGLILHKHGIFTFGKSAKEAYELMIEHITRAETRLAKGRRNIFAAAKLPAAVAPAAEVAPVLRGACAVAPAHGDADPGRWVMAHRATPQIMAYVNGADVADYGRRGVPTPDHIIRTKNLAMVVPAPKAGGSEDFAKAVKEAVAAYVRDYDAYFAAENKRVGGIKTKLDPMPRVVLVPGVGMFGLGKSPKEAAIAADLAENAIHVVTDSEAIGKYAPLDASNLFDIEYWSLEQSKRRSRARSWP